MAKILINISTVNSELRIRSPTVSISVVLAFKVFAGCWNIRNRVLITMASMTTIYQAGRTLVSGRTSKIVAVLS